MPELALLAQASPSLLPTARRVRLLHRGAAELLGQEVALAPDCVGDAVKQQIAALQNGQVLLLENVR